MFPYTCLNFPSLLTIPNYTGYVLREAELLSFSPELFENGNRHFFRFNGIFIISVTKLVLYIYTQTETSTRVKQSTLQYCFIFQSPKSVCCLGMVWGILFISKTVCRHFLNHFVCLYVCICVLKCVCVQACACLNTNVEVRGPFQEFVAPTMCSQA